ncbi:SDR family NAD(P)-dependent oxidoreductase [Nakamurella alba]|uniref:SDR family NAD(P)-dependent oxidoreductase n=1 Tax=Nakamurella alba TaxID=2665158 RepID=UPI0012B71A7F|nr:SDR family oxidoreductase [Nakamurella alba]
MTSTVPAELSPALGSALDLAGRTVVITGANSGIGAAVALGLGRMGMNVVGVARRTDKLEAVGLAAKEQGSTFLAVGADVTDEDQLAAAMDRTVETFGGIDCVVANAGIAAVQPALDMPAEDFRSVLDVNISGVFLTARTAARRMTGGGTMVLTSSSFAKRGFNDWAPYNASKAAVSMLAQTLTQEWVAKGIRVNAIAPTATLTDVNRALFENPDFSAGVVAGIPSGRIMQTEELVLPVAFLLSPRNQMMIGQTLFVDGGQAL